MQVYKGLPSHCPHLLPLGNCQSPRPTLEAWVSVGPPVNKAEIPLRSPVLSQMTESPKDSCSFRGLSSKDRRAFTSKNAWVSAGLCSQVRASLTAFGGRATVCHGLSVQAGPWLLSLREDEPGLGQSRLLPHLRPQQHRLGRQEPSGNRSPEWTPESRLG